MRLEHAAFLVSDPVAVAGWYQEHLGMRLRRAGGAPSYTHFLVDASGSVLLELYRSERLRVPDYAALDPLVVHLAFAVEDIDAARDRLLRAGATAEGEATSTSSGDRLAMLRDPWGFALQLACRKDPMI